MEFDKIFAKSQSKGKAETLKEHTVDVIRSAKTICKNLNIDEKTTKTILLACLLHDMGKCSKSFQKMLHKKIYEKENIDWNFINSLNGDGKRHEVYSLAYILFLNSQIQESEDFNLIKTAILFTHYGNRLYWDSIPAKVDEYKIEFFESSDFDKYNFKEYLKWIFENKKDIFDYITQICNEETLDTKDIEQISDKEEITEELIYEKIYSLNIKIDEKEKHSFKKIIEVMGLVKKSDYTGSSHAKLDYEDKIDEVGNTKINDKLKISDTWQYEVATKLQKDDSHLLLVAPTGSGKTEFALTYHKMISQKSKMIFVLPLRAALNKLYERYSNYTQNNVGLLHSTAFIKYNQEIEGKTDDGIEEHLASSKQFLEPYTLCTPEQSLLTSLKFFGFDNVLATSGNSTIVIDEIQAYTPEMNAIILKSIDQIDAMGGKILIMTATLPPYFEMIKESQAHNLNFTKNLKTLNVETESELKYENESISLEKTIKNVKNKRHKIELRDMHILEDALEILDYHKNNPDKNILIILNTVNNATHLYEEMIKDETINSSKVKLLHSRMIEKNKGKIVDDFGKNIRVLIATQILEASVDLDADRLYTQISPVESQVQRWGRVYRNRGDADYNLDEPNVIIYSNLTHDEPKDCSHLIYDKKLCDLCKIILNEKENVLLDYSDERDLVKEAGSDLEIMNDYVRRTLESLETLENYGAVRKSEAQDIFRDINGIPLVIPKLIIKDIKTEEKYVDLRKYIDDKKEEFENLNNIQEKLKELKAEQNKDAARLKFLFLEALVNNSMNIYQNQYFSRDEIYNMKIFGEKDENIIKELEKYGWCKKTLNMIKSKDDAKDEDFII